MALPGKWPQKPHLISIWTSPGDLSWNMFSMFSQEFSLAYIKGDHSKIQTQFGSSLLKSLSGLPLYFKQAYILENSMDIFAFSQGWISESGVLLFNTIRDLDIVSDCSNENGQQAT